MSLVFISYRREDSAGFAGRLCESLERRLGDGEVFRDADALEPGQDFVDAIAARLTQCKACLVLIGREWLDMTDGSGRRRLEQDNDYVRLEIAGALARADVLVVPVLVEGVRMPSSEELPESIRALSRRQAVSLRDETWDADVDRLVSAVRASTRPRPLQHAPRDRVDRRTVGWVALAIALMLVAILAARYVQQSGTRLGASVEPASPVADPRGGSVAASASAYAIAIPRLSEFASGDTILTILSAGVAPQGTARALRLRARFSNEGRYPANFGDGQFRLAVAGQVLSPNSGANEVVDGHSLRQGIISFELPADVKTVAVRVLLPEGASDLQLNLKSIGTPSEVEKPDVSDALSRAVVARLVREPKVVLSEPEGTYTLVAATARRFVNSLRIIASVRLLNKGRFPGLFSAAIVRLLADGQSTAPWKAPSEAVDSNATSTADFVFDVAPSVQKVSLRFQGKAAAEIPLDLPPVVR
jgi:hypothetical protein